MVAPSEAHVAHPSRALMCGTQRWIVKTLQDKPRLISAKPTTVAHLTSLTRPKPAPVERGQFERLEGSGLCARKSGGGGVLGSPSYGHRQSSKLDRAPPDPRLRLPLGVRGRARAERLGRFRIARSPLFGALCSEPSARPVGSVSPARPRRRSPSPSDLAAGAPALASCVDLT